MVAMVRSPSSIIQVDGEGGGQNGVAEGVLARLGEAGGYEREEVGRSGMVHGPEFVQRSRKKRKGSSRGSKSFAAELWRRKIGSYG